IPHVMCVRVCAPFDLRKQRMMERLNSSDEQLIGEEIRINDEAHTAIMRRHFGVQWTESEHYDVVLNTKRVSVNECVSEVLSIARGPQFVETDASHQKLDDLALAARVRAALRRAPETREARVQVSSQTGRITLSGASSTDEMLAFVEVASAVPGVRDVAYRTNPGEELRPRFH
ncbi:MAG TPA: cytidylate kinase family protein, partial [Burkholderiales bacterium]|nr:cytidylate kinase family protein [Burkholderiales bacterium]